MSSVRAERPLSIGDRVSFILGGNYEGRKFIGVVREVLLYELVRLISDDGCPILYPVVHSKQCRRLVKKRKAREWILRATGSGQWYATNPKATDENEEVRVREVLKKASE